MQARALYQIDMNSENTLHMIFSKRFKDKSIHSIGNISVNGSSVVSNTTTIWFVWFSLSILWNCNGFVEIKTCCERCQKQTQNT